MDSAIEISSGSSSSSSGSDDEVSEPSRTRSNTAWLYGILSAQSLSLSVRLNLVALLSNKTLVLCFFL